MGDFLGWRVRCRKKNGDRRQNPGPHPPIEEVAVLDQGQDPDTEPQNTAPRTQQTCSSRSTPRSADGAPCFHHGASKRTFSYVAHFVFRRIVAGRAGPTQGEQTHCRTPVPPRPGDPRRRDRALPSQTRPRDPLPLPRDPPPQPLRAGHNSMNRTEGRTLRNGHARLGGRPAETHPTQQAEHRRPTLRLHPHPGRGLTCLATVPGLFHIQEGRGLCYGGQHAHIPDPRGNRHGSPQPPPHDREDDPSRPRATAPQHTSTQSRRPPGEPRRPHSRREEPRCAERAPGPSRGRPPSRNENE